MKKIYFFSLALILVGLNVALGQTIIYSTNFGTSSVNATTLISGPPSWVRSGAAETNWRLATASASSGTFFSGAITASGGANLADGDAGTSTGFYQVQVSGINTTGYTSIEVGYIARKTSAHPVTLTFEWSNDGVSWNNITYTDVTNSGSWQAINGGTWISLPAGASNQSNLRFRWSADRPNTSGNYRIDDFTVRGTLSATPTITLHDNSQVTAANVEQGTINHILSRFRVNVATADATLNSLSFTAGGTFVAGDMSNFRLFTNTANDFSTATQISTVSATSIANGGTVTFGSLSQTCAIGDRYFWITGTVAGPATVGNTVSVPSLTASNFTFAVGTPTGTISAAGAQTIIACLSPTNATGLTLAPGNTQITVSWTNPTCYDEVMIVAKASSSISGTPTGDGSDYTANLAFGSGTAFDGGFVVYKGFTSPQTITGLTNGTTYFVRVFTRKGTSWTTGVESSGIYEGYFWNGGDITANPAAGGTGTWTATNAWRQPTASGSQATWADNNIAVLAGTAGVVTLTGNVTVTELFANTSGYALTSDGTTGRTITGPITIAPSTELRFNDTVTGNRTISVAGNISGGSGSSIGINMNQTGNNTSRLNLASAGATLSVPINIYTGSTSSNHGNFAIVGTASNTVMTSAATITNNTPYRTTIGATSGNSITVNSVISGSADLMFAAGSSGGAGTITLNAAMNYTGNTIFNAANSGVILLGVNNALPTSTNVTMGNSSGNGGIFDLNGFNQTIASLSNGVGGGSIRNNGSSASTLTINGSTNTSFSLPIENGTGGGLSVTKGGSSTLELTGANTYTGTTTINGGNLRLNRTGGNTIPAGNDVVVNSGGTLRISTNQTLNNLTINSGGIVTVDAGAVLTVNGTLSNSGTIELDATASGVGQLLHNSASSGNVITRQFITGTPSSGRWIYLGSPTSGAQLNSLVEGSATMVAANSNQGTIFTWDATNGQWSAPSAVTDNFVVGRGYITYIGKNGSFGPFTRELPGKIDVEGAVTSGASDFTVSLTYGGTSPNDGWNLIANPWPVTYDFNGQTISSAHFNVYAYTDGSYKTFNTDGTGNAAARYLTPMMACFVRRDNTGPSSLTFELTRRVTNQNILLTKPTAGKDEIGILVKNTVNQKEDELYVTFSMDGHEGYLLSEDAEKKMNQFNNPNIFTYRNNRRLVINQLPQLSGSRSENVGFQCAEAGTFTISIKDFSRFDSNNITVTLEDKLTNTLTVLNNGDYTFTHNPSNNPDRFVLHFNKSTVSTIEREADKFNAWIYDGVLYVKGFENLGNTRLSVTDMSGRVVFSTTANVQSGIRNEIALPKLAAGVYVLRVEAGAQQKAVKFVVQ